MWSAWIVPWCSPWRRIGRSWSPRWHGLTFCLPWTVPTLSVFSDPRAMACQSCCLRSFSPASALPEESDRLQQASLRQPRSEGWKVIRIWPHALQKSPTSCLNRTPSTSVLSLSCALLPPTENIPTFLGMLECARGAIATGTHEANCGCEDFLLAFPPSTPPPDILTYGHKSIRHFLRIPPLSPADDTWTFGKTSLCRPRADCRRTFATRKDVRPRRLARAMGLARRFRRFLWHCR